MAISGGTTLAEVHGPANALENSRRRGRLSSIYSRSIEFLAINALRYPPECLP
jgi:hypothetical protein